MPYIILSLNPQSAPRLTAVAPNRANAVGDLPMPIVAQGPGAPPAIWEIAPPPGDAEDVRSHIRAGDGETIDDYGAVMLDGVLQGRWVLRRRQGQGLGPRTYNILDNNDQSRGWVLLATAAETPVVCQELADPLAPEALWVVAFPGHLHAPA